MTAKKLIAGNWKMNCGTRAAAEKLANGLAEKMHGLSGEAAFDMLLCPPATVLSLVANTLGKSGIWLGAQDCHFEDSGAYTGNIAAPMLADFCCTYVIVGHSERRAHHQESNELVARKAAAAQRHNLIPIICIGEQEEDRDAGRAEEVVGRQLKESLPDGATAENTVIAYEPVWAIGTGKSATPEDIAAMHGFIRERLADYLDNADDLRILYGGSVKPGNAVEILSAENVDGALVGGASLKVDDFWEIAMASSQNNSGKKMAGNF